MNSTVRSVQQLNCRRSSVLPSWTYLWIIAAILVLAQFRLNGTARLHLLHRQCTSVQLLYQEENWNIWIRKTDYMKRVYNPGLFSLFSELVVVLFTCIVCNPTLRLHTTLRVKQVVGALYWVVWHGWVWLSSCAWFCVLSCSSLVSRAMLTGPQPVPKTWSSSCRFPARWVEAPLDPPTSAQDSFYFMMSNM